MKNPDCRKGHYLTVEQSASNIKGKKKSLFDYHLLKIMKWNFTGKKFQLHYRRQLLLLNPQKNAARFLKNKQRTCSLLRQKHSLSLFHSYISWLSFPKHNRPEDILCSWYNGSPEESVDVCVFVRPKHKTPPLGKDQLSEPEDCCSLLYCSHTLCWEFNLKWTTGKWN